jgi:subtilisin
MDDNWHGTAVAGVLAASWNDFGIVGVAPEAALYALKVLGADGAGRWSAIIAALDW